MQEEVYNEGIDNVLFYNFSWLLKENLRWPPIVGNTRLYNNNEHFDFVPPLAHFCAAFPHAVAIYLIHCINHFLLRNIV